MVRTDKNRLFYISWLTLFGMGAMSVLIIMYLQKKDVPTVLMGRKPFYLQLITGLFFGSLASLLAVLLVNGKKFKSVRSFLGSLVGDINPSFFHIVFFSFCAGVGEEMLFRAGIQPLIGIWPASILFVLMHGYISPSNLNLTMYGIFLLVLCAGFGYLFKFFGLLSAAVAHIVYDISMFSVLKYTYSNTNAQTETPQSSTSI